MIDTTLKMKFLIHPQWKKYMAKMIQYFLSLVEICDFVTNEFATSCDYLTFTTIVGYIYN
jgi:hypothetical protein